MMFGSSNFVPVCTVDFRFFFTGSFQYNFYIFVLYMLPDHYTEGPVRLLHIQKPSERSINTNIGPTQNTNIKNFRT